MQMSESTDGEIPQERSQSAEIWRALYKSRWLILATTIAVVSAGAFYTLGQTKIYRAAATLQVDPSPMSPLGRDAPGIFAMADAFWNNQEYYATQFKIIASRRTATDVVRKLGLNKEADFLQNVRQGAAKGPTEVSVDAAAAAVQGRLTVQPVKESRLVTLSFDDADPQRARKILSAIIDAYLQRKLDEGASTNSSAGEWLRDQLGTLKQDLEDSEISLHTYKMDKQILSVSLDEQTNMLREEMQRLHQALTDVRAKREHVRSRSAALDNVNNAEDPGELPNTELLENSLLSSLRVSYIQSRAELSSVLNSGKDINHPDVRSIEALVDVRRQALMTEIRNVQGALRSGLAALTQEIQGLSSLYETAKKRAMELGLLEIEYRRLERTKENNEKLFGLVLERSKESDLAGMMRFSNVHVIDAPLAGTAPVKPRVLLNLALSLVVGLILGVAAAMLRAQLDRSIKTSEDIERELKLSFLGSLPFVPGSSDVRPVPRRAHGRNTVFPELLAFDQPNSALAEAARGIRTNLMFMSVDQPYRTLLITSSGPGDGKTTVACAIAIAMAQAGQRVLLIDCDLRRPRLHRVFNRTNDVGLTSVTLDPTTLESVSLGSQVENLDLLPSGPMVPNPAEFLHSEAFAALLKRLRGSYDRIVMDSPPAAVVSDGAIMSTLVDGTVFVVRASKTHKETARKAIRSISGVSGRMAGAVLNAFDVRQTGYGKYYGYQYSYYRADPPNEAQSTAA